MTLRLVAFTVKLSDRAVLGLAHGDTAAWLSQLQLSSLATFLVLFAFACITAKKPSVASHAYFIPTVLLTQFLGPALIILGALSEADAAAVAGTVFMRIGKTLLVIFLSIACLGLFVRNLAIIVVGSYACALLANQVLLPLDAQAALCLCGLLPVAAYALQARTIRETFARIAELGPSSVSKTWSVGSVLPFAHPFFACSRAPSTTSPPRRRR